MKKVLLLSPQFYGYWSLIKRGMEREFYSVDVMLYPSSFFFKLLTQIFFLRKLQTIYEYLYYRYHLRRLSEEYEFVVMVKPSVLPLSFLLEIKEKYVTSKFVSYIWDDIKNDKKELEILNFFEKIYSYSKEDCLQFGFVFRPMFYNDLDVYHTDKKSIDLFYIGSYYDSRFYLLVNLINEANVKKLIYRFILRCSLFLQFSKKEHLKYKYLFQSKNLSYEEMMSFLEKSRCSIEIPFLGQSGTTTRPIESLATKTKIITTNKNIVNNPLYHPSNCYVIDSTNPIINVEWLYSPFQDLSPEIMNFYSLKQFVRDILNVR